MNPPLRLGAVLLAALVSPAAFGTTASSLGSFEGSEEPTVIYHVKTDSFTTGDSFKNITDRGSGVFRMELRFVKGDHWDGDRGNTSGSSARDRGRAEVKGLGSHQKVGDTFDYSTTWRTSSSWAASGQFDSIFQLKTTDTDSVMSNIKVDLNGVARFQNHSQNVNTEPRTWNYSTASWQTVRMRIKISTSSGIAQVSINGDSLKGTTGKANYWVGAADYRPKWGLYRKQTADMNLGDNYVEHSKVSASKQ
jgi:hypothetical protein